MCHISIFLKYIFRVGEGQDDLFPKVNGNRGNPEGKGSSLIEANRLPGITTNNNQNLLFSVLEHDVCVCACVCVPVYIPVCVCVCVCAYVDF